MILALALLLQADDEAFHKAMERGVAWLLKAQSADGAFGAGDGCLSGCPAEKAGTGCGHPAVAAMAGQALLAMKGDARAIDRALDYVVKALDRESTHNKRRRIWSYTLAPRFLVQMKSQKALAAYLERLWADQTANGGWGYHSETGDNFIIPMVIETLVDLRVAGVEVPRERFDKAVERLTKARLATGAYAYSGVEEPSGEWAKFSQPKGSLARSLACELAIDLADRERSKLGDAVARFFADRDELEKVRWKTGSGKDYVPHTGDYKNASYYFLYAHGFAVRALSRLDEETRKRHRAELRRIYVEAQDAEGWWADASSPAMKAAGTAMALLALDRLR